MNLDRKKYLVQVVCVLGGLLTAYLVVSFMGAQGGERVSILLNGVLIGSLLSIAYQFFDQKKQFQATDHEQSFNSENTVTHVESKN